MVPSVSSIIVSTLLVGVLVSLVQVAAWAAGMKASAAAAAQANRGVFDNRESRGIVRSFVRRGGWLVEGSWPCASAGATGGFDLGAEYRCALQA